MKKTNLAFLALLASASAAYAETAMTVWKTPWCGCCQTWTSAMEAAGYKVTVKDMDDLTPIKRQAGVPGDMEGCHTAMVDGYFLEGHVPLEAIAKLRDERPAGVAGIAVPGMPAGSLGMGDDPAARYDVYAVSRTSGEPAKVYYEAGKR